MAALFNAAAPASGERWPVSGKIGLFLFVLLLGGCGQSGGGQQAAPPPPQVKVAQPLQRQVLAWDEFPGRVEAVESVDVRARVDGYLEKVNFKAGDSVQKGDLLFLIDPRPFRALLNHA